MFQNQIILLRDCNITIDVINIKLRLILENELYFDRVILIIHIQMVHCTANPCYLTGTLMDFPFL